MTKEQHHKTMGDWLRNKHNISNTPMANEILNRQLDELWGIFIETHLTHITEVKFKQALIKDWDKGLTMTNLLKENREILNN